MATSRGIDREREDALGKVVGVAGATFIALYGFPQILVAAVGILAGACCPSRFEDPGERRRWRATGWWLIGAGVAVGAAYFALFSVIGTDAQWRRFDRKWVFGHLDASALAEHPWAWLPIGAALAIAAAGATILWRTR